ncbi:MAG TPA: hypothetical protein VKJ45_06060 [Blastocatellia bacterium]|nr:hypothetical protein [Blastocatellia bacterium]
MVRPLTPSEAIAVIWRRKTVLFLVAGIMIISTFLVIRRMPDRYESMALVVVASSEYKSQEDGALIAAVIAQLSSRTNLESVVERNGLRANEQSLDESIKALEKNITLETRLRSDAPGFPESFHISYRSEEREKTPAVLSDLVSCFEQANAEIRQRKAKEETAVNAELAELDSRSKAGARTGRASAFGRISDYGEVRSRRSTLQANIQSLSKKEFALQQQIADQESQIREQQRIVRAAAGSPEVRGSTSYGLLLIRRAELEAQLKEFSKQYTAQNPKVMQATTQLQEINRQIAQLESGGGRDNAMATSPEGRELRALERELSRMNIDLQTARHEIDSDNQELARLPVVPITAETPALSSEDELGEHPGKERLIERYTALLGARDSLNRLKIQGGGTFPDLFKVVDQPNQPLAAIGPNRRALMAIAIGLALALGAIAAFLSGLPSLYVIDDERDVEYLLGARVVALIPETLTPGERARTSALKIGKAIAVLVVATAMVPLLAALLNGLQVFQTIAGK